jgi:hypothetical protein
MNPPPNLPLDRVQRWFQAVILHPNGIAAGVESDEARAEIDAPSADALVTPSTRLTAIERLQVYGHAYFARLLECLQDEFPAFRHAVGDEAFHAFVFGYLQAYPSRSYTLSQLGARFPQYLAETEPTEAEGAALGGLWTRFVVDLVRLERLYSDVFDGPGMERETLLQPGDLLAIPPDRWGDVRLVPAESLRVVEFAFPVDEYAAAVRRKEEPDFPEPAPRWLAIYRANYIVRRQTLTEPEYHLLRALAESRPLAEAIGAAVDHGASTETLADDLRAWFTDWTSRGFFRRVQLDP